MIGFVLQRAAARHIASSGASRLLAAHAPRVAPLAIAMRGLRISAIASAPAATKEKKAATKKPATKTTAKKSTTAKAVKKPSVKAKAKAKAKKPKAAAAPKKKKKKVAAPKPKAWELRDDNGKLVPLPSASKPTRSAAYNFYVKEHFSKVAQAPEHHREVHGKKGIYAPSVMSAVAVQWKAMSAAEKKPYLDLEAKSKVEYEKALLAWQASLTPVDIARHNSWMTAQQRSGRRIRNTRLRDPLKPRRPDSPFFEFMQIRREEARARGESGGSVSDFAKAMGSEWRKMSDKEKEPFQFKAQGAREQYEKSMIAYKREVERREAA